MTLATTVHKIEINDWTLCRHSNQLLKKDIVVQLENRQSQLLEYLAERAGENISKTELLEQVWGNRIASEDSLYVCIANLRKALGDNSKAPSFIKTIPGAGYRLIAQVKITLDKKKTDGTENISTDTTDKNSLIGLQKKPKLPRQKRILAATVLLFAFMIASTIIWQLSRTNAVTIEQLPVVIADQYRQARYFMTPEIARYQEGLALFESIIKAEPRFAGAYADLALSRFYAALNKDGRGTPAEAKRLSQKALALDPNNETAHFSRALIAFVFDWNFEEAQQHFEQALNNSQAELFYAQFLVSKGEFDLAEQHIRHYVDNNPKQYSMISVAWVYAMSHHFEKAEAAIAPLETISPDDFHYRISKQFIYQLQGQETLATIELLWLMEYAGYATEQVEQLRIEAATHGIKSVYRWLAFEDSQHLDIGQYTAPYSLARYALAAGDAYQSLQHLEASVAAHKEEVLWLRADPAFDELHSHPKFQQLIKQIGLDQFTFTRSKP